MSTSIEDQLAAAVGARKDSLKALRYRIIDLVRHVPVGVKLTDNQGVIVEVVRLFSGASQWDNSTWDVTIKGWGLLDAQGNLIAEEIDSSLWDGNNMHHRSTEPTCRYHGAHAMDTQNHDALRWTNGKNTRTIAERLPEGLARYMAECETEREANDATLRA